MECKVCNKPDSEKPMAFRGEEWCCEKHRQLVVQEKADAEEK